MTGSSSILGAALTGGQLTVGTGQTLTLNNDTVTGSTITDSGTVRVDAGQTLNLSGVSLTGGAVGNAGTVEITRLEQRHRG